MKLVDTTFLIDILRGKEEAKKILESNETLLTTQLNMYEVIRGMFLKGISSSKFLKATELFKNIRVLSLDDNSIIKSADISSDLIKKGNMISEIDSLIAGIALSKRITTIVTKNKKHFGRIKGLKVETY